MVRNVSDEQFLILRNELWNQDLWLIYTHNQNSHFREDHWMRGRIAHSRLKKFQGHPHLVLHCISNYFLFFLFTMLFESLYEPVAGLLRADPCWALSGAFFQFHSCSMNSTAEAVLLFPLSLEDIRDFFKVVSAFFSLSSLRDHRRHFLLFLYFVWLIYKSFLCPIGIAATLFFLTSLVQLECVV